MAALSSHPDYHPRLSFRRWCTVIPRAMDAVMMSNVIMDAAVARDVPAVERNEKPECHSSVSKPIN
jgi:hypothetical protein